MSFAASNKPFRACRRGWTPFPTAAKTVTRARENSPPKERSLLSYWATKKSRVVAPGPIWTPLLPPWFGDNVPLGRAGQPAELAPFYVLLASDDASYISGARVAVTGGRPIL